MPNKKTSTTTRISDRLISTIGKRLSQGKQVRRTLPVNGRLHVDRTLPFLCVYRRPTRRKDPGTEQLVKGEASYLVASGNKKLKSSLTELIRTVTKTLSRECEAFLIIEIWSVQENQSENGAPQVVPRPAFRIIASKARPPTLAIEALEKALKRIVILRQKAKVEVNYGPKRYPPGLSPLLPAAEARKLNCSIIGLEVAPAYRNPVTGEVFPIVLRTLHHGLATALKRAVFEFSHRQTSLRPRDYQALGPRAIVNAVWQVDRRLADISSAFDFLLQVTPVNTDQAWAAFKRKRFEREPVIYYRPLPADPAALKRKLYEIPIERVEDPTLAFLFREKRRELDRQLSMLSDRETSAFLYGSMQLYGGADDELVQLAKTLLKKIPRRSRGDSRDDYLKAAAVSARAREEIQYYRKAYSGLSAKVYIRDDIAGLMVSRGNLLVGKRVKIPASRIEALLQHEIGTHILTYFNGKAQPFKQLFSGLAGYEELQEGLAVLAEYMSGGLSRPRMRLLAGRVVAVRCLVEGASFIDTFRELNRTYGFKQSAAFMIAIRIYRGGGLTKDAVYLRGLVDLLNYLKKGGALEPLFVGKIATDHIPIIRELQLRGVLRPVPLRPRYMESPQTADKLKSLKHGLSPLDLIERRR